MLAAAAMTTLGALPVFLLSAQAVLVREDLQFSEPQLGLAVSAFFGSAAVASLSAGALVERLGRRSGTVVAGGLAAANTLLIATAAHAYGVLLALLVMGGVANAALQMTANVALARSVRPERQGLGFGIKQSAIPVAILLGGLAVPTVGVVVGWRWTFVAAALAAVVVIVAGLRMPQSAAGPRPGLRARDRPPPGALLVSFTAMVLASAAVNSLGAFLPAWSFHVGLAPGTAGLLLAAASALSVLARILTGVVADRRRGRNLPVVSGYLLMGAVGLGLLSVGDVPMLVVGALVAFGIGWAWPGLFLFAVVRVGRDSPATASGSVQAGAFTGGAAGPVLFGLLVAATSYPTAWRTAAAVLVVAAVLLMVARRMFVNDLRRRPPSRPLDTALPPEL
jgi:MFS family permease